MKIDLKDRKNLIILSSLVAGVVCAVVLFLVLSSNKGLSEDAKQAAAEREARGPLPSGAATPGPSDGAPAGQPAAPGTEAPGPAGADGPPSGPGGPGSGGPAGGPGGPELGGPPAGMPGAPGEQVPGAAGAPKPAAGPGMVAEGDGSSVPKGPPVEPYRGDPFVQPAPILAMAPQPVLAPWVVVRQPPQPLVMPATVNVIPTSIIAQGSKAIQADVQRRLSGVLWNGAVYAILESPNKDERNIWRPGDQVGDGLWVKSISRSQMVLVRDGGTGGREEIVVDLKEAPKSAQMGLGPGGPMGAGMPGPAGMPLGPGMPGMP